MDIIYQKKGYLNQCFKEKEFVNHENTDSMLFKGLGGTDKKRRRRDGDYVGHTWIVNVVSGMFPAPEISTYNYHGSSY